MSTLSFSDSQKFARSIAQLHVVERICRFLWERQQVAMALVLGDELFGLSGADAVSMLDRLARSSAAIFSRPIVASLGERDDAQVWRVAAYGEVDNLHVERDEQTTGLMQLVADEIAEFVRASTDSTLLSDTAAAAGLSYQPRYDYSELVGKSLPMIRLYRLLDKVVDSESTILIQGENGTGKELIAKAIHFNSVRRHGAFVVQNCSAFNDNLLDSELFGHRRGAFTGAINDKRGLFEVADGGTFFLDEIGDMSPALQVKVLRVLQEGTFMAVGDTAPKQVDVRIIAATNRNLKAMVESGQFREDLYYRINVINLTPPPLRERRDDIAVLVEAFLRRQAINRHQKPKKLTRGCMTRIAAYHWPGNVRELENEIERLVVLSGDAAIIGEEMLSSRILLSSAALALDETHVAGSAGDASHDDAEGVDTLPDAMRSLERNMIYEVLKRNRWNKTRAAAELKISRRNLIRKVQKYQLERPVRSRVHLAT